MCVTVCEEVHFCAYIYASVCVSMSERAHVHER